MKKIASLFAALVLGAGVQFAAFAQSVAPDALIKSVTDDVIAIVRQDKAIQSGDTRKAVDLVETKVLPYFDFAHMTRLAVGKDWRQANPEQKAAVVSTSEESAVSRVRGIAPSQRPQKPKIRAWAVKRFNAKHL